MGRSDLGRLSREEPIELVLQLQRPDKTSRTFSKPPSTGRKERREQSKPGGAKPGHEGHSRVRRLLAGFGRRLLRHARYRRRGLTGLMMAIAPALPSHGRCWLIPFRTPSR
jgi:hypothetical protein